MAGFDYVPLNNNKKNEQAEQHQAMQQMLQMGQLMMYKEKQDDLEADRDFKQNALVLSHPEFGEELQLKAVNNIGKRLGLTEQITIDGLKPYSKLFREMSSAYEKGGVAALDDYGTALRMFQEQKGWTTIQQQGELPKYVEAYNTRQAEQAVEHANPVSNYVAEARARNVARASELTELRANHEKHYATVNGQPGPVASSDNWLSAQVSAEQKAEAQTKLDRLRTLEDEDQVDQAIVNEDTYRTATNSQAVQWAKTHPDAIAAIGKYGMQGMGVYPTDDNYMKARYAQLLQIPTDHRTEEDARQLDLVQTYLTGKSAASMRAAATAQRVTQGLQSVNAESDLIKDVRGGDAQGQEMAEQHRTTMQAITEGVKTATQSEEEWQRRMAETRGFSMLLGEQQKATLEANQPQAEAFMKDRARLEEDRNDLRKRVPTMPGAQREDARDQIRLKEDLMQAREAQAALLTTHHPLRGLDFEWQAQMQRQEADHLKAALAGATGDEKTKLDTEYAAADTQATKAEAAAKQWTSERNHALASLTTAQASLDHQTRVLDQQKTATQRAMEKDEATAGLYQTMLTDMTRDGLTMTQAFTKNYKDFPNADGKKAQDDAVNAHKFDYGNATHYATVVFSGLMAASGKEELSPKDLASFAANAAAITKKQTGMLVGTDDIMKAYQTAGGMKVNVHMPASNVSNAIETGNAYVTGKWIIDKMLTTIDANPTAVAFPGAVKQLWGAVSQQWAAVAGAEFSRSKEAGEAFKQIRFFQTPDVDTLQTMHKLLVYQVARVTNPVGILSDADAEAALSIVGDITSWRSGPDQVRNKLIETLGYMKMKAEQAEQIAKAKTPADLFRDDPRMGGHDAAAPPAGKPGQPKTEEEFFKKYPNLRGAR